MRKEDLSKLYAVYKAGYLKKNLLDTFFIFFANIMLEEKNDTVNSGEVNALFKKKYQIELPETFVRQVLSIGLKNGCIVDTKGAYLLNKDLLGAFKFKGTDFDKMWPELLIAFSQYCISKDIHINEKSLEKKILRAIDNTDDMILSNEKVDKSVGMGKFEYAWYSFVKEEAKSNIELFDFVTALCASNVTKQAIFYEATEEDGYAGLNVYLDSPMVFALLGMDSADRVSSYQLLLQDMQKAGCSVQILDHNYQEIEGIISNAALWAVSQQYDISKANNATKFFHDSQLTDEEITEFVGSIEYRLNELGILIKDTDYEVYSDQFQEDEKLIYDMIKDRYNEQSLFLSPEKQKSIEIDVRSIIMIYRERQGNTEIRLNKVGHIMLTTNNAIANVCKDYENSKDPNSNHIPTCISADLFGAILWLSSPNSMMNYQRKKVLADCYDYLQPTKAMIEKYVASLDNARELGEIDEKKFLFMRTHPIVRDALMDVTQGDYARFSDRTYIDVYDHIMEQADEKYRKEEEAHNATKKELEKEKELRESLESELEENKRSQEEKIQKDMEKKCHRWGTFMYIFIFGAPYVVFVAIIEIIKSKFSILSKESIFIVSVLGVIILIAAILRDKGRGWCIKRVRRYLEKKHSN